MINKASLVSETRAAPGVIGDDDADADIPSVDEQKLQVEELLASEPPLKAGDTWYLISQTWMKSFMDHLSDPTMSAPPGPIDNSSLLNEKTGSLKRHVHIRSTEHRVISADTWAVLSSWYPPLDTNHVLPRPVYMGFEACHLDFHPLQLIVVWTTDEDSILFSQFVKMGEFRREICDRLGIDPYDVIMYDYYKKHKFKRIQRMEENLFSERINDGQPILFQNVGPRLPIGGVPFDGRTVKDGMLVCIERLTSGKFDAVDEWILQYLFDKSEYSQPIQDAIDGCTGAQRLYLKGLQQHYAYGVDCDEREAFRLWSEGVEVGDPSGRCQTWLAICYQGGGEGIEVDETKADELFREALRLGTPHARCYVGFDQRGKGHLWELAHNQGYVEATSLLGTECKHPHMKLAYFHQAARRGDRVAIMKLRAMQSNDRCSVIPFGCWHPHEDVHKWVVDTMDLQMICLLIAHQRNDCIFAKLPRDIILSFCFYLCCRPFVYRPSVNP